MSPLDARSRRPWRGDVCLIVGVAAVDALLLAGSHMAMVWSSEWPALLGAVLLGALYLVYSRWRPTPRLAGLLGDALRLLLFTNVAAVLSYLLTALPGLPLRDSTFDSADRLLGFDWSASYHWLLARPAWMMAATVVYDSATVQIMVLLLTLGLLQRRQQADELFYGFAGSALLVIGAGALLPSAGAFVSHASETAAGADYVSTYHALRSGQLRRIDLFHAKGLVQFPSFHAALAGLFVYVSRSLPWLFWPLLILNTLMLAACPALGGHYLVDLLAGLAILATVLTVHRRFGTAATPAPAATASAGCGSGSAPAGGSSPVDPYRRH